MAHWVFYLKIIRYSAMGMPLLAPHWTSTARYAGLWLWQRITLMKQLWRKANSWHLHGLSRQQPRFVLMRPAHSPFTAIMITCKDTFICNAHIVEPIVDSTDSRLYLEFRWNLFPETLRDDQLRKPNASLEMFQSWNLISLFLSSLLHCTWSELVS